MDVDLLIHDADSVYTCAGVEARRGRGQRDAGRLERASIAADGDQIVWIGPAASARNASDFLKVMMPVKPI